MDFAPEDFTHEDFALQFSFENIVLYSSSKTCDDDIQYDRQDLVTRLSNRKCSHYLNNAINDLDWILKCTDDNELMLWACKRIYETQRETKHILCHSPRDVAIQTLLDNAYIDCDWCFTFFPL